MPIVTVEVVAGAKEAMPNLAQSLADVIGGALNSPPGQTWVRVRSIAREQYAENGVALDATELPVFVTVLKQQGAERTELEREVAALTAAIAHVVSRPATSMHPLQWAGLRSAACSFNEHAA
jgi:phenylpyruvate tautomerase PptA (4-oxalocrotonate tautomerase family)